VLAAVLDVILPPRCAGCGDPGAMVCPGCALRLRGQPAIRMPEPPPAGLPACWSSTAYEGVPRKLIIAYKERGRTALAPALAACLAGVAARALGGFRGSCVLVPVPSVPAARRRRGYDPIVLIATRAVQNLREHGRAATLARVLRPGRRVADQTGLSATERAANLSGAFWVADGDNSPLQAARGRTAVAVLVDDIVTTGATLAEAARALGEVGIAVPLAITVAATRRSPRHAGRQW
jgi:predicted amidophosphoribosyltransferase